jgi:hypothetical protein
MLIIAAILLSYIPAFPMDDCQESDHSGTMQLHCGYLFHCPFLSNFNFAGPSYLPYAGQFDESPFPIRIDGFIIPIFHPPENTVLPFSFARVNHFWDEGMSFSQP